MKGYPYLKFHLQTATECLACLFLEAQTDDIIVAGPAGDAGSRYDITALGILLDQLTIEVSAEAYRGIGELSFDPVLLVQGGFQY